MTKKIKHKVFVTKNFPGSYSVTEMTFDKDGSTVLHRVHASNLDFRNAQILKTQILCSYE